MKFLFRCSMFVLVPLMALFLFAYSAVAIEWKDPATNKIAWDAAQVAPAPKTVTYRIYIAEPSTLNDPIFVEEVSVLAYTLSIPSAMGVYYAGVSTVLNYNDSGNTIVESGINWSNVNDPVGSTPDPFGWKLVFPPANLFVVAP